MTHALIENALLLFSLCWLLTFNKSLWQRSACNRGKLFAGLWFGVACVIGMSRPLELAPGLIFDARSVVLSMAALFGGPLVGGLAALVAAAYRLWIGGVGVFVGLGSVLLPVLFGLAYRQLWLAGHLRVGFWQLLGFGVVLHLAILGTQLLLPGHLGQVALAQVALPLLLFFPPVVAALGVLLDDMRRRAETLRALHLSEARHRAITQAIPDLLAVLDLDGRILEFSSGDPQLTSAELEGRYLEDLLGDEEAARIRDYLQLALEHRQPPLVEYRLQTALGERVYEGRARRLERDIDGRPAILWLGRDVTERKQFELEKRIAAIAFESQQGMFVTDSQTRILRVNKAFTAITGYQPEDVLGQQAGILGSGRQDATFYQQMWHAIQEQDSWQGEIWNRRKNGEIFPEWLSISAVRDDRGQISHYVAALTDITERRAADERIRTLAFYDPLTGLPNRRLLLDRLQQAIFAAERLTHCSALMFIDLDGFKNINDLHGHQTGDLLLQAAATRLQEQVRTSDTVARLGGDEFVVMLENLAQQPDEAADQAEKLGKKILAAMDAPYRIGALQLHSSASIGVVLFSDASAEVEELLTRADISMYEAKSAGKNALRFFDAGMQKLVGERMRMEADIFDGLAREEFTLHIQPQMDEDLGLVGGEALLRWQHPQRGLLAPEQFLESARRARLIQRLDLHALEQACRQLALWSQDPRLAGLSLSVNLSAASLYRDDFVDTLLAMLERHHAQPVRLCLELTETLLLDDIGSACERMERLRAKGVRFSIDDFGTGYSSIFYLQRLPLDQLKIDQSFIDQLVDSPASLAITRTIGALAQSLQLQVIAEGVETRAQHALLLNNGCRRFQGHLFGRPMPVAEFERYCEEHLPGGHDDQQRG